MSVRITCLYENTPGEFKSLTARHGLSLLIETGTSRILMDTGQSEELIGNAQALGIDLGTVDFCVISHGHYDHTGGLEAFAAVNRAAPIYLREGAQKPHYSVKPSYGGIRYIGMSKQARELKNLVFVGEDRAVSEEAELMGDLGGCYGMPRSNRYLKMLWREDGFSGQEESETEGKELPLVSDDFRHEQCLVLHTEGKSYLFSGCAHSGLRNILERYRGKYGAYPDWCLSGFHLAKEGDYTEEEMTEIRADARFLAGLPTEFVTMHCTGIPAYEEMKAVMGDRLRYMHCGDILSI